MNIVMGILLLLYAAGMALYCRPVQRESLSALLLCALTGVFSLLSAPPVSAVMGIVFLLLQMTEAGICGRLLYTERCERRERAAKRREAVLLRETKPAQNSLQSPRAAG